MGRPILKIITKLQDIVIELVAEQLRVGYRKDISNKTIAKVRKELKDNLENEKFHRDFEIVNGEVSKLIVAREVDDPVEGVYKHCDPFFIKKEIASKDVVKEAVARVERTLGTENSIKIILKPSQKKTMKALLSLGFNHNGFVLVGEVSTGLKYLKKQIDCGEYDLAVERMLKKDIPEVIKLRNICHLKEKTSRLRKKSPRIDRAMKMYYAEMVKGRSSFVIRNRGKIIAATGVYYQKHAPNEGLIADITVSPRYQGRGLATLLYYENLKSMSEKGIKTYRGATTTEKVLRKAKKMKRRVMVSVLSR